MIVSTSLILFETTKLCILLDDWVIFPCIWFLSTPLCHSLVQLGGLLSRDMNPDWFLYCMNVFSIRSLCVRECPDRTYVESLVIIPRDRTCLTFKSEEAQACIHTHHLSVDFFFGWSSSRWGMVCSPCFAHWFATECGDSHKITSAPQELYELSDSYVTL